MSAAPTHVGPVNVGPADAAPVDAAPVDAGPVDAATTHVGPADVGPVDVGPASASRESSGDVAQGRAGTGEHLRVWDAGRPVDLHSTLQPLVRGGADPAHRFVDGRFWWACATPDGEGTVALDCAGASVRARAWGKGAGWLLWRVPALLGADDDWSGVDLAAYPQLQRVLRSRPGMRLCATGLVLDCLVPAILEQRVTGREARRAWRSLLHWHGTPAPGPTPFAMRVPPSAATLREVPTWDWHRMGVDGARHSTIRAAASVARRIEQCAPDDVLSRLRVVPGIGEWTAAETAQRAFGHPDAVSVGDYHLKNWVTHALTGRARGTDEQMMELLEPWAGQRQRVVRLIEVSGLGAPRFGPRFAPTDIRGI